MSGHSELTKLAVRLGQRLTRDRHRLATAESCTGGWIAKTVTDIAGSSEWFTEGFVTYSNQSKHERLGVPNSVLRKHGAVSEATARAMAAGALRRAGSDVAVAVTGIAGPGRRNSVACVGTASGKSIARRRAIEAFSRRSRCGAAQNRARGAARPAALMAFARCGYFLHYCPTPTPAIDC